MKIDMAKNNTDTWEALAQFISHQSVEEIRPRDDGTLEIATTDHTLKVVFLPLFGWKVLEE